MDPQLSAHIQTEQGEGTAALAGEAFALAADAAARVEGIESTVGEIANAAAQAEGTAVEAQNQANEATEVAWDAKAAYDSLNAKLDTLLATRTAEPVPGPGAAPVDVPEGSGAPESTDADEDGPSDDAAAPEKRPKRKGGATPQPDGAKPRRRVQWRDGW
jgi:hypothetical protein